MNFLNIFSNEDEKKILVCTPEKLQFIFHHELELMSEIDLYVFDEGHMFDDMSRGAMYELLIADIKKYIQPWQQIVLLSAVLSNADRIKEWVIGDDGVLAYDKEYFIIHFAVAHRNFKALGFLRQDNVVDHAF